MDKMDKKSGGVIGNIAYMLSMLWKTDKFLILGSVIAIPFELAGMFIAVYMPAAIVDTLDDGKNVTYVVSVIIGIIAVKALTSGLQLLVSAKQNYAGLLLGLKFMSQKVRKTLSLDYEQLFDPEIINKEAMAGGILKGEETDATLLPSAIADFILNLACMLLFGGIIGRLNPFIALLLVIPTVINYIFTINHQKFEDKHKEELARNDRKMWYVSSLRGGVIGKDVRVYGMKGWISAVAESIFDKSAEQYNMLFGHAMRGGAVDNALVLLRDGAAYFYLIYQAVRGNITSGEFVLYFSVISSFSGYISTLFECVSRLHKGSLGVGYYRAYMDIAPRFNKGAGIPVPDTAPSIELAGVSYKYPGSDKAAIEGVSLKIAAGEKIAMVGLNGAGKTTLIKLICGMITPTEGEIFVNGRNINEYNRDEYYGIITALFQQFRPLPLTIAQNIAAVGNDGVNGTIDEARLKEAVSRAGLDGYIARLPDGLESRLVRQVNDVRSVGAATEPSGGEMQKILLARAYYHRRPMLILDEPTSALDPIAESDMYRKYLEFSRDKTSVFISHRLASTRFCDRIILLENGKITEVGTHGELISAGGKYRELFDMQSKYYKDKAASE